MLKRLALASIIGLILTIISPYVFHATVIMVPVTPPVIMTAPRAPFTAARVMSRRGPQILIDPIDCEYDTVAPAITSAADNSIITIPVGTCSWNSAIDIESANMKQIIIQGNGESTTIKFNNPSSDASLDSSGLFVFTTVYGKSLEIRDFRIMKGDDSYSGRVSNGPLFFKGFSRTIYVHDMFFLPNPNIPYVTNSCTNGVNRQPCPGMSVAAKTQDGAFMIFADNEVTDTDGPSITQSARYFPATSAGSGNCGSGLTCANGNGSRWAPLNLGHETAGEELEANIIEDNTFTSTQPKFDTGATDCDNGGRFVFRFNTLFRKNIATHGSEGSNSAGCERVEVYHNTIRTDQNGGETWIHLRGGANGPVFNNAIHNMITGSSTQGMNAERNVTHYKSWRGSGSANDAWMKCTGEGRHDDNDYIVHATGVVSSTSSPTTTLTLTGAGWTVNQFRGYGLFNRTVSGGSWFHGTHRGSSTGPFTITDVSADTLIITIDGGTSIEVDLTAGSRTTDQVVAEINTALTAGLGGSDVRSAKASNDGNRVRITSDSAGTTSIVTIAGDAATALGMTADTYTGASITATTVRDDETVNMYRASTTIIESNTSDTLTFMNDTEDMVDYFFANVGETFEILRPLKCISGVGYTGGSLKAVVSAVVYPFGWPDQEFVGAYFWGNRFTHYTGCPSACVVNVVEMKPPQSQTPVAIDNRDFFSENGAEHVAGAGYVTACSMVTFDGTCGVGVGTFSAMPATCTANVGYFATDRGGDWWTTGGDSQDGAFYRCVSTNVWELYYTPSEYPHPSRSGETDPTFPGLDTISPEFGAQGETKAMTLTGTNFNGDDMGASTVVNVSGTGITQNTLDVEDTVITVNFVIAGGATTGARTVSVTTSEGTTSDLTFTVNGSSGPSLTSIVPALCIVGTTCPVTLTGTNFNVGGGTITESCTGISFTGINIGGATTITANAVVAIDAPLTSCDVAVTTNNGTSNTQTFQPVASSGGVRGPLITR